jgi:hypothetical protein
MCSGFSANLIIFGVFSVDLAWRLQLAAACIPAIPLLVLVYVCPGAYFWKYSFYSVG